MDKAKEIIDSIGNTGDKLFTSKEERLEKVNEDRINAREMQNQTILNGRKFSTADILALFWSLVASAYIFAVTFLEIPIKNQRIADTITGFLMGTIIAAIINFFFGSSDGSKTKSHQFGGIIERLARNKKD